MVIRRPQAREKGAENDDYRGRLSLKFSAIAFMNQETGECGEQRLHHSNGEAEKFYGNLRLRGVSVRVGLEATGYTCWFERLLAELAIEVRSGGARR